MKIDILIPEISGLTTATKFDDKGLTTAIKFEAKIHPGALARILNLQRQGAAINITIASAQAAMDLSFDEDTAEKEATV